MKLMARFALILNFLIIPLRSFTPPKDPSPHTKTTPEIAERDGYPLDIHYVTTPDGYILGTHRISYTWMSPVSKDEPKPVVILHHGIGMSSANWFLNSPGKRLPYILADAGYDVWLANIRGNLYSRNHTHLSPDSRRFWDFSCQEMGLVDLPALVDYILESTGVKRVSYIGHSMGTTIFFILTSTKPSYNEKFDVSIALAPIVFTTHMKCPPALLLAPMLKKPGPATDAIADIFTLGNGEFFPSKELMEKMTILACTPFIFAWTICSLPAFVTFGFDYAQINTTVADDIWGHIPQGSSIKTFIHYGQLINSNRFCMFDYGTRKNQRIYGSDTPPDFALENISAPLYLIAGPNDLLASPEDLEVLRSKLTGVNETWIFVDYPTFNHLDFLFAIDANRYINYPVLKILNKHNGKGQ